MWSVLFLLALVPTLFSAVTIPLVAGLLCPPLSWYRVPRQQFRLLIQVSFPSCLVPPSDSNSELSVPIIPFDS